MNYIVCLTIPDVWIVGWKQCNSKGLNSVKSLISLFMWANKMKICD